MWDRTIWSALSLAGVAGAAAAVLGLDRLEATGEADDTVGRVTAVLPRS